MKKLLDQLYELDTPEISDALDACGIEGALFGIKPVSNVHKLIGPAFTVQYFPYEEKPRNFQNAGNYIDDVPPGAVIVIDNFGREDCTVWGDILTQFASLKNISGTVINGVARDVDFILKSNYSLFSRGIYMRSGKNRVYKFNQQIDIKVQGVVIKPNDIIFGDKNGVIVIPQNKLAEVVEKAINIRYTEQNILESVKKGISLKDARNMHHYEKPWLKIYSKECNAKSI